MITIDEALFTDDLLSPKYRAIKKENPDFPNTFGHCYVAAEAAYHLYYKEAGFRPCRARDDDGNVHWWLQSEQGWVIDPTSSQYTDRDKQLPYSKGKFCGFLTKEPSKRAVVLMERIKTNAIMNSLNKFRLNVERRN